MDEFEYHLRKIGPTASCDKVPKFMRLHLGQTKIGRGQNNDYYLDSKKLKNFISRYHAEVIGKKNENGRIEFTLWDKGLNGTFINDIRTQSTCVLEVGDKITFGHTNGYRIKPGEQATQPLSEFQFLFERVPRGQPIELEEENSLSLDNVDNHAETLDHGDCPSPKMGSVERSCLSLYNQSNVLGLAQTKPNKDTSLSNKAAILDRDSRNAHSTVKLDRVGSVSSVKADEVDGTESSSDSVNSVEKGSSDAVNSTAINSEEFGFKLREDNLSLYAETLPDLENGVDKNVGKSKSVSTKSPGQLTGKVVNIEPDSVTMSDDSSLDGPPNRAKVTGAASKRKKPKQKAQAGAGAGSRRRKRKKTADGNTSDELEDGVEWYEEDTCASSECKRPKKKRTPWVQCDSCDEWYHTMCVGASYDKVKDSDIPFNCGYCV